MAKYKYSVDGGRYGGECTVGTVSEEFVNYWAPIVEEEGDSRLIEHVCALDSFGDDIDEGLDADSPNIGNDAEAWYEIDDIEHLNSMYSDGTFMVSDVTGNDDEFAYDENEFEVKDPYTLKGREGAYISTELSVGEDDPTPCTPVLLFHSGEKGGFGSWFIETDEPFDSKKFVFSVCETHLGEFVEDVWYNKQLIECNMDYNDTMGKAYYAAVGWITDKWRDEYVDPEGEDLSAEWEDYDDNLEWEAENES